MKVRFVHDEDVNPESLPESEKAKVQFRMRQVHGKISGTTVIRKIPVPYFPAGTIYERADAFIHVLTGVAEPADDECAEAVGLSSEEVKILNRKYLKNNGTILKKDWGLFDAGVIEGYDDEYTDHQGYIPGQNWAKYQEILAAEAAEDSEDDEEGDE